MRKADRSSFPSVLAALSLLLLVFGAYGGRAGAQAWCIHVSAVPPYEPPPPPPDPRCEQGGGGGSGGSEEECNNCTRSPCYVASGAFVTQAVDLDLRTAGFPLVASRAYQSTHQVDGPMGHGWTSGLTARLYYTTYLLAPGTTQKLAYVILPSGARAEFADNGDGTFTPPLGRHDYLVQNADGSFDLWLQRSVSSYHFGADGQIESMTDEYGNQLVYSYDGTGRLLRVEDASGSGRYLDVYWGADGRISNVVDSAGRQVGYTYDAEGMLTAVTDPVGRTTTYTYVEGRYAPLLAEARDEWDRVVQTVTYDEQDRTTSYTDQGETYTYTYNYQGDPTLTAKTDSSGNTWVYTHGEGGLVIEDQAPGGATSRQTEYYPDGSIMLEVDEVGVKTFYTYDSEGLVLSVTQDYEGPQAVRFDYEYDEDFPGQVASVTPRNPADDSVNPHWQAWRYDYWPEGAPAPGALHHVYRVRADGSTLDALVTYEYDAKGRPAAEIDAAGGRTDYVYDPQGNLVTVRVPANNTAGIRPETHYAYNATGQVISVTDPMDSITTYTHDAAGRVLTATPPPPHAGSPLDFTTTYTHDQYDAATGLTFTDVTDPSGHITKRGYDQHGRLVEVHDALGAVTRYDYTNGLLASITDAHGYVTSPVYDSFRRLRQTIFPDGATESYTYYADGQLATKTDRKNQTSAYTYDALKRLKTRTYPDGTGITYTYQGEKLAQVTDTSTDPDETHTFTYDDAYRIASNTQGPRGTIDYTYTPTDRVASMSVVGGPTTSYTYHADQSVHTIQWTPLAGSFDFTYTLRGQYDTITFPNGQRRLHDFDDQGRLTQIANVHPTAGNLATYTYGYDTNHFTGQPTMLGQRTSVLADVPAQGLAAALTKYYYDAAYQLIRSDYPAGDPFHGEVHEWTYDMLGNRLTSTVDGATEVYTYEKLAGNANNGQRLLSDGANSYSYDANGNTTVRAGSLGTYNFSWNPEDFLVAISGAEVAVYVHDAEGRRARMVSSSADRSFLYDDLDLISESGTSPSHYLLGPKLDDVLATSRDSSVYYYSVDGLGSVALVADVAGASVSHYAYDAWGVVRASNTTVESPFGFTGREVGDAGQWHYRARQYWPQIGRFNSEDPLRYGADMSHYRYVLNTPTYAIDPSGLEPQECQPTGPWTDVGPPEKQLRYSEAVWRLIGTRKTPRGNTCVCVYGLAGWIRHFDLYQKQKRPLACFPCYARTEYRKVYKGSSDEFDREYCIARPAKCPRRYRNGANLGGKCLCPVI